MKRRMHLILCAAVVCASAPALFAQNPGGGPGAGGPPRRQPPMSPLMKALDVNGDGELSAEEIANAPAALKTLDKNHDGKLDQSELRPVFEGGFGGPGGPGGFGGPGGPGGFGGGFGGPGGPGGGGSSLSAEQEVARYMTLDKNGDGKLTKDEVPERMQGLFARADANGDGVITKDEIEKMVAKAREARQQGGGPGGFGGPPPEMMGGGPGAASAQAPGELRDAAGSPTPSPAPTASPNK